MHCEASEGWQERMATKLAFASVTGATVGTLLSIAHNSPFLRTAVGSTASFALLIGVFSTVQEGCRRARCMDSLINSTLGGAAAGAVLFASHGASVPRGIVMCGAIASAAHAAADTANIDRSMKSLLISLGLLDPSAMEHEDEQRQRAEEAQAAIERAREEVNAEEGGKGAGAEGKGSLWQRMRPYLPLRKMTDAEWEEHQGKRTERRENWEKMSEEERAKFR